LSITDQTLGTTKPLLPYWLPTSLGNPMFPLIQRFGALGFPVRPFHPCYCWASQRSHITEGAAISLSYSLEWRFSHCYVTGPILPL